MRSLMVVTLLFTICLAGCKSDKTQSDKEVGTHHNGLWLLNKASRNGVETNTLEGLFYRFDQSEVISNISGDTITSTYVLKEGKIYHMMTDTLIYDVMVSNDSLLEFSSNIQGMPFNFEFVKQLDTLQW